MTSSCSQTKWSLTIAFVGCDTFYFNIYIFGGNLGSRGTSMSHDTWRPYLPLTSHLQLSRCFHRMKRLISTGQRISSIVALPAVQYPSPLHGHRWITRPGLAQFTERCSSSENTPLPSYSNGLCVECPFGSLWYTIEGRERCGWRKGGAEVLRWHWGGLMRRRRVAIVSRGNRDTNSTTPYTHRS